MPRALLTLLLLTSACYVGDAEHTERLSAFDVDGDGFNDASQGGTDCDDDNAEVNPDGFELCNGIDDNCDGVVDEGLMAEGYVDADGDGVGDGELVEFCAGDEGYAEVDGDCDDSDANVNPNAFDDCGGIDEDCNGITDDFGEEHFLDSDGDGYGLDGSQTDFFCSGDAPAGWSDSNDDCDDSEATTNPGAFELCGDGVDNDCDGEIDTDAADVYFVWDDADNDGYGDDLSTATEACGPLPAGKSDVLGDCDDSDANVHPDAPDDCDGNDDENCNGIPDDGFGIFWSIDEDGDGYGDASLAIEQCDDPGAGWTDNADDCDDSRASVNPAGIEACNSIDDDCNGTVDDNIAIAVWWADTDGDGFGDASAPSSSCSPGSGFVQNKQDCDDTADDVNPLADELCSNVGVDNDCDGDSTEQGSTLPRWYLDSDSDGYGDPTMSSAPQCDQPTGYVADNTDCDDTAAAVNPGETEVCATPGVDDDCSGAAEDNAIDRNTYYVDDDEDGWGDPNAPIEACDDSAPDVAAIADLSDPAEYDCDDTDSSVYPTATESCNLVDDDCDGDVDEGALPVDWYLDSDGDGFGAGAATNQCDAPSADHVRNANDCLDSDANVHPNADELCSTVGVDDDCSGVADDPGASDTSPFYVDTDSDGHGAQGTLPVQACTAPSGTVASNDDCDDSDATISPSDPELCSTVGVDDDCDGTADEIGASDAPSWYPDSDDDGFGATSGVISACNAPTGYLADNTDCDDTSDTVNTSEPERCSTPGVDDDCNGTPDDNGATDTTTWYRDLDDDGVGLDNTVDECTLPSGYSGVNGDCDDNEPNETPGGTEVVYDGFDNDCNPSTRDNDLDLDGVDFPTDCDDNNASVQTCFPSFPYDPPNVDETLYMPSAANNIDFTGCTGPFTFDSDDGSYSSSWSSCTATPTAVSVDQGSAGSIWVIATTGWTQPSGKDVRLAGDDAVVVLVYGDALIDGEIEASSIEDDELGAGGNGPLCTSSLNGGDGESHDKGGGGGGGGSGAEDGADGGEGGSGNDGDKGVKGVKSGNSLISPLRGGCRGGDGGRRNSDGSRADGGYGGGALQFSVAGELDVDGDVWAGGGRGEGGNADRGGGGGGGGGGAILLQGDDLVITGRLAANGGGGGGGCDNSDGFDGQDGNRTGTPSGGNAQGGAGPGGNGGSSADSPGSGGDGGSNNHGGGGGGGGVGEIELTGNTSCSIGGTISPDPTEDCP